MLLDQPVPHQFVMLLVLHTLAVRTRCHDYRDWTFCLWSVNVVSYYKSVIHRNGNVSFDYHRFGWITRGYLNPLGTTKYRYDNQRGPIVSSALNEPVNSSSPLAIQMRHLSFCVSGTSRSPLRQGSFNHKQVIRRKDHVQRGKRLGHALSTTSANNWYDVF